MRITRWAWAPFVWNIPFWNTRLNPFCPTGCSNLGRGRWDVLIQDMVQMTVGFLATAHHVIKGIENYKRTYSDDAFIRARCDIITNNISPFL